MALTLAQVDPAHNSIGGYGGGTGDGFAGGLTGSGQSFVYQSKFYFVGIRTDASPGTVGVFQSTDGLNWTELAAGTGPLLFSGANNPIAAGFDGNQTVYVAGHNTSGTLPLNIQFATFNLATQTWGAPITPGGGFLANSLYSLQVFGTTLILIDVYQALVAIPAPGRYINISKFDTTNLSGGPSSQVDGFTNAFALGSWNPTRSHLQGNWIRTLYITDDASIALFFNTFSFDAVWSNRCFYQKYIPSSGTVPSTAGNFFEFPGQSGSPQDLIVPTNGGGPLCAPLLVPISGVNGIVLSISRTLPGTSNIPYPTLYIGKPATAPVWTEYTNSNGIDAAVNNNHNLGLQTGIAGAFDSSTNTFYFVWVTATADDTVSFAQVRLSTLAYNGTDPTAGWGVSQVVFDMTVNPGPGGGGNPFYPGNTLQQNLVIPSILASGGQWLITIDANVPASNYFTEARYSFAAQGAAQASGKLEISLFGTKRFGKSPEPECVESPEPKHVKLFC